MPASSLLRSLSTVGPVKAFAVVAVVSLAGAAAAAITITYSNNSTLTTSATSAPVQFLAGDDAGPSALTRYVTAYALSTNSTYFTATLAGVPEASLVIGSFFKIRNVDSASHGVTLSTANVTNSLVTSYTIQILDDSSNVAGTLDLRSASGTVSQTVTIPASTTYTGKVTIALASGAGANNVALTNALSLGVS